MRITYLAVYAFVNDRHGAALLLLNILAGSILFMYVILSYTGVVRFNQVIFDLGFLAVFGFASVSVFGFFLRQMAATPVKNTTNAVVE